MKVLVLTTRVPFMHGGAEELRDHLVANLRHHGADAEAISIPFSWEPAERLIDEMWIARSLGISNVDRVIALRFPAYLVPHSNKVLWLLHQYRQAYDLWDAGQSNIPENARGEEIRRVIRAADALAFSEARQLFTNSPVGQRRLQHYNQVHATVLPPPLNDPDLFCGGSDEGYLFAGGRVGGAKRQALLVQALRHAPDVRLVIAGPPESEAEAAELIHLAGELGVAERIRFELRLLPRAELAEWVNRARAVVYIPFDEDSVGYVTMEAFQAGKPVVTTTDTGGVLEIVQHGETGLVAEPSAEQLGAALAAIAADPATARDMGATGRQRLAAWGLTWPKTIEKLLG